MHALPSYGKSFWFLHAFWFCRALSDMYWNQRALSCSSSMLNYQTLILLQMLLLPSRLALSYFIWHMIILKFVWSNLKFMLHLLIIFWVTCLEGFAHQAWDCSLSVFECPLWRGKMIDSICIDMGIKISAENPDKI